MGMRKILAEQAEFAQTVRRHKVGVVDDGDEHFTGAMDFERLLVQEALKIHRAGKMLVPIIDDAHLMPTDCLRKLRLLCEDFPHSHNLVLLGQPPLLQSLALSINEEIRSRVTYSVVLPRLAPETIEQFVLAQLDRAG